MMQEGISKGRNRIKVRGKIRHQLQTMHALVVSSSTRPSSMYELVPGQPPYTGATDAAKAGMGGVWFVNGKALLWQAPFPVDVQEQLVSYKNSTSKITNSDLELLGTIAHHHVLEEAGYPMAGESTHTFSNNTPAVAWQTKESATTSKATANLLRHSAFHQRATGHVPAYEHLAGVRNIMADLMMPAAYGNLRILTSLLIVTLAIRRQNLGKCYT
jgi:hypothetical protein